VTTAVLLALGLNSAVASSQSINFLQQNNDSNAQSKGELKNSKQVHAKENNNTKESAKKKLAKEIKKSERRSEDHEFSGNTGCSQQSRGLQ
ncbi:hypothetical protein, partial [Piscirickettsia litoralis]|uniref:hypothetical protein n=1 Tax=Piscirickettsia litoralis TaxID=1891921 RepID=UPI001300F569